MLDQSFVLCGNEQQEIEIVNCDNFRSAYKFNFTSSYGQPREKIAQEGVRGAREMRSFQKLLNPADAKHMRTGSAPNIH